MDKDDVMGDEQYMETSPSRWHDLRKAIDHSVMTMAVISERQKSQTDQGTRIEQGMTGIHGQLENLRSQLDNMSSRMTALETSFHPVRAIVYGLVGLVMLTVFGAMLALALRTPT